jgi:glycolate oxidase FAD binding subunit
MDSLLANLIAQVKTAAAVKCALCIRAGGTKDFYGNTPRGEVLDPRIWSGIENYEPSELVMTARAGTSLKEIETTLAEHKQMLAFEPPHFGDSATIGGCIASGLAGPRRSSAGYSYGGVRDAVLGARLLDGHGRLLKFGGTVMKNVAGYDVSRVLAGSMGTLGLIVDVSLKVLPVPEVEATLQFALHESQAIDQLNMWGGQPLPISASAWLNGQLFVRLSGSQAAVMSAQRNMSGEVLAFDTAKLFWLKLREHQLDWFANELPLWRVSLPSTAAPLALNGEQLIEWGGSLRWLKSELSTDAIRQRAEVLGGHATLFRRGDRSQAVFTPLKPTIAAIHRRLKNEFDPAGIFNPGRLYTDF